MAKIISINNSIVEIGEENGALTEVRMEDMAFSPRVGDIVDIFRSEGKVKVILSDNHGAKSGASDVNQNGGGININLSQTQQVQTPVMQPTFVQAGKVVSKIAYCLLAFFLGGIGVHKFYAGKTGTGVLFLLFCWTGVPAIIGVIDCIIGITKKADVNGNIIV